MMLVCYCQSYSYCFSYCHRVLLRCVAIIKWSNNVIEWHPAHLHQLIHHCSTCMAIIEHLKLVEHHIALMTKWTIEFLFTNSFNDPVFVVCQRLFFHSFSSNGWTIIIKFKSMNVDRALKTISALASRRALLKKYNNQWFIYSISPSISLVDYYLIIIDILLLNFHRRLKYQFSFSAFWWTWSCIANNEQNIIGTPHKLFCLISLFIWFIVLQSRVWQCLHVLLAKSQVSDQHFDETNKNHTYMWLHVYWIKELHCTAPEWYHHCIANILVSSKWVMNGIEQTILFFLKCTLFESNYLFTNIKPLLLGVYVDWLIVTELGITCVLSLNSLWYGLLMHVLVAVDRQSASFGFNH